MSKKYLLFDHVSKMYYRGFHSGDEELEIWTENVNNAFEFDHKTTILECIIKPYHPNFRSVHWEEDIPSDFLLAAKEDWNGNHMTLEILKVYTV